MMKIASVLLGLVLTGFAFADSPKEIAVHKVEHLIKELLHDGLVQKVLLECHDHCVQRVQDCSACFLSLLAC